MSWKHTNEWLEQCSTMVQYAATEANPEGLAAAAKWYTDRFQQLGFLYKPSKTKTHHTDHYS